MGSNLDVSVIIPVYNGRSTVEAAINSALAQSRPPLEVIVVDDGSTDGLVEADLVRMSPLVRYIQIEQSGACAARNRGISAARAPWVAFLDADDVWFPEKLDHQFSAMSAIQEDRVLCTCNAVVRRSGRDDRLLNRAPGGTSFAKLIWMSRFSLLTSGFLVSKDLASAVSFDESRRNLQDLDFVTRSWELGVTIIYSDVPLFGYSHTPSTRRISNQPTKVLSATQWYISQIGSVPFRFISTHFVNYCVNRSFLQNPNLQARVLRQLFFPEPARLFWLMSAILAKAFTSLASLFVIKRSTNVQPDYDGKEISVWRKRFKN